MNAIKIDRIEETKSETDSLLGQSKKQKTKNLGCGNSFAEGRCDDPESGDVENCVWSRNDDPAAK